MIEILSAVAVCDNCYTRLQISGTNEEWLKFHSTWFEGVLNEYCPACQVLPHVKVLIQEEQQIVGSFRKEPEAERDFPEFIS